MQPKPAMSDGERIVPLEGIRGIMAWWVVLGHVAHTVGLDIPVIAQNALAVDVFIILSGFVITSLIVTKQEAYLPYITRRALRIFPAYLVVLALSALLLPLYAQAMLEIPFQTGRNVGRLEQARAALENLPEHLATHMVLLQGLVPNGVLRDSAYTIVGQAWSISLEWQFYLVAPLVIAAISSKRFWPFLTLACIALLLLRPGMSPAFLGAGVFSFGIGISSYYIYSRAGAVRAFAAAVAVFCAVGTLLLNGKSQAGPITIWIMGLAIIIKRGDWVIASKGYSFLSLPLLRYLGDRSYSVYLVHMIPLYLTVWYLNNTGIERDLYPSLLVLGTVFGTALLSELSYRHIERPFIRLGRRIVRKPDALVT